MAFGTGTISSIGGAVQDLFASEAHGLKAKGLRLEAENYELASGFATKNAEFADLSRELKQSQMEREIFKTIGGQTADVAGAGFAAAGTALDLLRDSASQGALMKAVANTQGLITEEGYRVQSETYANMAKAANFAAEAEDLAGTASMWGAGFKAVNAVASIFMK
jgi:hypothetical protein